MDTVATSLYKEFYSADSRVLNSEQASSHWKSFSSRFRVEKDENGNIKKIEGFGFGGSDDKRLVARLMSATGNTLVRWQLQYDGLQDTIEDAKKTVQDMGLAFSQDAFRQACTLFFLGKKLHDRMPEPGNILVIGDGHGILSALLKKKYPKSRIYLVDLGATLFFQAYYLGKTFPADHHQLSGTGNQAGFYYCPAEKKGYFPDVSIDLAINIASMQEMDMKTIQEYFDLLRSRQTKIFYCCNRLEKELPDGQVTRFMEYPWEPSDIHLTDEECAWHRFFVGKSDAEHIKVLKVIPVPLVHRYDGIHWHRLSLLTH